MARTTLKGFTLLGVAVTTYPVDKDAYDGLTYVKISEVMSMGPLVDQTNMVSEADAESGRITHTSGSTDGGQIPVALRFVLASDAGQTLIRTASAAEDSANEMAFKKVYPDNSFEYFVGRVKNYGRVEASADTNDGATFDIFRQTAVMGPFTS